MQSRTPISVKQAAVALGVSGNLIRKMLKAGKLRGTRIESCIRVYQESIEEYLDAHEFTAPSPEVESSEEIAAQPLDRAATVSVKKSRRKRAFQFVHIQMPPP